MRKIKEKFIGFLLILLGLWPFLLKIEQVGNFFEQYTFLAWLTPGEVLYQVAIIVLGVLLIWKIKPKMHVEKNQ
ncbi:MAG: hypothetical protein ACP5D2_05070 [Candidatus Nanoarchaeia archaeon]